MKNSDILHRSMNLLLLTLEKRKLESEQNDDYVNGMLAGAKLMVSLVEAWEIETPIAYADELDDEQKWYPVKVGRGDN